MRRPGHIRQRSRDSFELRYGLGTDPATGKRRVKTCPRCGRWFKAGAEGKRNIAKFFSECRNQFHRKGTQP